MIINGFTGKRKNNENMRYFTITSAYNNAQEIPKLRGAKILVQGLDDIELVDQNRAMLSLRGQLNEDIFTVTQIDDIALHATIDDIVQLSKLVGTELPPEVHESLKRKLEKISLQEVLDYYGSQTLIDEQFTEAEARLMEKILETFNKNGDFRMTFKYLNNLMPTIDYPLVSTIYNKLRKRAKRSNTTVYDIIRQSPHVLTQLLDFRQGEEIADKIAEAESWEGERARVHQCASRIIEYMLSSEEAGNCFTWKHSIYAPLRRKQFTFAEIKQALDMLLKQADKRTYANIMILSASKYEKSEQREMLERIARESYWPKSHGVEIPAEKLHALYFTSTYFAEEHSVNQLLIVKRKPKWETEEWDKAVNKITDLDANQKEFLLQVPRNRITILTGGPGSGKTTVLKKLINMVAEIYGERQPVVIAPTALAAQRAAANTVSDAHSQTVHRYVKMITPDEDRIVNLAENLQAETNARLIVVDEASMLTPFMLGKILSTANPYTNIVFSGDDNQLPPVGPGGVFPGLIKLANEVPNMELVRLQGYYRGDREIKRFLDAILEKQPLPYNGNIRHTIASGEDETKKKLKETLDRLAGEDVMILTPYKGYSNTNTQTLNIYLQSIYNPDGKKIANNFRLGDKVVAIKNDYQESTQRQFLKKLRVAERPDIFNGMQGVIKKVKKDQVIVEYKLGRRVIEAPYRKEELPYYIELAYAMTVHKMQGAQGKHIIFVAPGQVSNPALFYTAASRCLEYGTIDVIAKKDFWQPAEVKPELSRFYYLASARYGYIPEEHDVDIDMDWSDFELPVHFVNL